MKNRKITFAIAVILIISLLFGIVGCGENTNVPPSTATIMDINVQRLPKTEYHVGDTLSLSGGVLTLKYTDNSTKTKPMTDTDLNVSRPDMSTVGKKMVRIEFDGFNVEFQINVSEVQYDIVFNPNYSGASSNTVKVEKGSPVSRPADLTRSGYRFNGWFTDAACTVSYDFTNPVTAGFNLYAGWSKLVNFTFDLNYAQSTPVKVQVVQGQSVAANQIPSTVRQGFVFDGWFTNAVGGVAVDLSAPVTADKVVYAHWTDASAETVYTVTFKYNDDATADGAVSVINGNKLVKPSPDPSRYSYSFDGWHTDPVNNTPYDFTKTVGSSFTLYAHWKVSFHVLTFVYKIDGVQKQHVVKEAIPDNYFDVTSVNMPVVTDYYFVENAWYTSDNYSQLFNFDNTKINSNYTFYAHALKKNTFEAEYTYIDDNKPGQGSSNNQTGIQIIGRDNGTANASNEFWVGSLFYSNAFIEFVINAEEEINDAVLVLRLTAEFESMYIASTDRVYNGKNYYAFTVTNGKALVDGEGALRKDSEGYVLRDNTTVVSYDYEPIALENTIPYEISFDDKRPCTNHLITTSLKLHKGANVFRLTVANAHSHDGTMHAEAPMIDCMYIYTDSNISWTPVTSNIDRWLAEFGDN